jgi:AcrR family transcriptional regulator
MLWGMSTSDGGMRERKKRATRQALSAAALRLAREHGPQNVRVDDIAEAAGVSPRTYNNYFSSREQAIVVALAAERGHGVAAALRERPADEPLEHAVVGALIEQYSEGGEPDRDALALITSAPALRAEFLDTIAAIERPLADAIAARTGAADQGELRPEVLAAAVSGAARVAAERWLQPEPDVRFSVMLNEALMWIVPALRAPVPGRPGVTPDRPRGPRDSGGAR